MKRLILIILSLFLCFSVSTVTFALPAGDFPVTNEDSEIAMILAGGNQQPHPTFTDIAENLDTLWIFFTDGTFRQFVVMNNSIQMFSCGTYSQENEESLLIRRMGKYMEGAGFQNYSSVHPYTLTLNKYSQIAAADSPEKQVTAVRGGLAAQPGAERSDAGDPDADIPDAAEPHTDKPVKSTMEGTWLIVYSDGTLEQYMTRGANIFPLGTGEYNGQTLEGDFSGFDSVYPVELYKNE